MLFSKSGQTGDMRRVSGREFAFLEVKRRDSSHQPTEKYLLSLVEGR